MAGSVPWRGLKSGANSGAVKAGPCRVVAWNVVIDDLRREGRETPDSDAGVYLRNTSLTKPTPPLVASCSPLFLYPRP